MKKLKLLLILGTVLMVSTFASGNSYPGISDNNMNQEVLFLTSKDDSISPCQDFYQHACGNWQSDAVDMYKETLTKLDFEIKQDMQRILEQLARSRASNPSFVQNVYNYYKSCMDAGAPQTVEYMKWLEQNERNLVWPLGPESNRQSHPQRYDWIQMLAILQKYGMNDVIFHETAASTEHNANQLILEIGLPQVEKNFESALRYDVVTHILRFFMQKQEYDSLWRDIEDLDRKLMDMRSQYEQEEAVMFLTLDDSSEVPWLRQYLSELLENSNLDRYMNLVITNMPYLRAVEDFLGRHDPKFVCEYLQVKFLSYLHHKQLQPEYKDCVTSTRLLLPLPAQWLYERNHPELRQSLGNVTTVFANLKRSFSRILDWNVYTLNPSLLKYLKGKLRTQQLRVGFLTSSALEDFYQHLTLEPHDYYGNRLKIYKYHFQATHNNLGTRLKRTALNWLPLEEYDTAAALQPYLLSRQRYVVLPLSLLQPPFSAPGHAIAYQYSSIGFHLARNLLWEFTISDIYVNAYGQILSPILDQLLDYEKFQSDYNHVIHYHPGAPEQVDTAISGLKLAYHAFMTQQGNRDMSKFFFLNFAQMYCSTADANEHRPSQRTQNRQIVNSAVEHVADFHRVFECGPVQGHDVLYWGSRADTYANI